MWERFLGTFRERAARLAAGLTPSQKIAAAVLAGAVCLGLLFAAFFSGRGEFTALARHQDGGELRRMALKLENAGYAEMLEYLEKVTGKPLHRDEQPFKSTETLRKRRNATIHKSSAIATVPMVRAALFSAVEGCRHTYLHAGIMFPYESFLAEYPIPSESWFSDVPLP